jgi:hypothetical protein
MSKGINEFKELPAGANGNILINGDFRNPINQAGAQNPLPWGYGIDGWFKYGGNAVLNDGYLSLSFVQDSTNAFGERLEPALVAGRYVTGSLRYRGYGTFQFHDKNATIPFSDDWREFAFTHLLPADGYGAEGTHINIWPSDTRSIDIEWIKLEYGKRATPFVPEDPAIALIRCQRYLYVYEHRGGVPLIGVGFFYHPASGVIEFKVPDHMRDVHPGVQLPSVENLEITCEGNRIPAAYAEYAYEKSTGSINIRFDVSDAYSTYGFVNKVCTMQMFPPVSGERIVVDARL